MKECLQLVTNSDSGSAEDISSSQEKLHSEDCQEHLSDVNFFTAKKIFVHESNPASLEKIGNTNSLGTNSLEARSLEAFDQDLVLSEITSDSDVSLVNCYDVTQSVVYRKLSKDNNEEIQTAEQFLDFESLEASLNHEETNIEQEPVKPIAKPRKHLNSIPVTEYKMQTVEPENDVKLTKYKEASEESFESMPYVINKRSDNTLIKKIYSDPSVRSFALNNRNKLPIPVEETTIKKISQPLRASPEKENTKGAVKNGEKTTTETSQKIDEAICFPSTASTGESNFQQEWEEKYADIDCFYARAKAFENDRKYDNEEKEINELKEQKLVSSRLKAFSKSSVNLSRISDESLDQSFVSGLNRNRRISVEIDRTEQDELFNSRERSTSVKDLRKKFEQFDAKAKSEKPILYSLTGRSISKQFKEKLRDLNEDSLTLSQINSLSLTNLEVEENKR